MDSAVHDVFGANLLTFHTASFDWTKKKKGIIACLDVRNNDKGDLVVTKGDQYVRKKLKLLCSRIGLSLSLSH